MSAAKKEVPRAINPIAVPDPEAINLAVLLTPKKTATLLRTSVGVLEQWRHRKKGPRYVKCGAKVLYRRSDLEQWLAAQTVEVAP